MGIQINNVSFHYATARAPDEWALKNIDLEIEDGEIIAILGKNGAGKSSLSLLMNGMIPNFYKGTMYGDVHVNGKNTRGCSICDLVKEIGIVFQNPFDQITGSASTVYEEVAIGPENFGFPREESIARVNNALQTVGITELKDRNPYQLSGGQQQRVAIASILAMQPKIMVFDEPTSQLDPLGTEEVFATMRKLNQEGRTIIFAEHKVDNLASMADRIVVLLDGRIVSLGTPQEVLTDPKIYEYGILPPQCTQLASRLHQKGLWSGAFPLNISQTKSAIQEVIDGAH
jgi:energy-coupling factor transport system ATP-binding protein